MRSFGESVFALKVPEVAGSSSVHLTAAAGKQGAPASVRGIQVSNLTKLYETQLGWRRVLDDISFSLAPGEKIAVLGRNGAGKSTLVRIIGGVEMPSRGSVHRGLFQSWPIAFSGGFEVAMSGFDNIRFIARVYDVPIKETIDKVDDFAELGRLLYLPVKTYSSGMRARLA